MAFKQEEELIKEPVGLVATALRRVSDPEVASPYVKHYIPPALFLANFELLVRVRACCHFCVPNCHAFYINLALATLNQALMFSRPDSPPPRQPSPDLIHTPLTTPPRRRRNGPVRPSTLEPVQRLATSRSCDGLNHHERSHKEDRQMIHSHSCENIDFRGGHKLPERRTREGRVPSTHYTRTRHISFGPPQPPPFSTQRSPPVPPLPAYLRLHQDDSDTEKSSEFSSSDGHGRPPSIRTLSSNDSLRRKCKSPPPLKHSSCLASLTRLKFFSRGGNSRCSSARGPSFNIVT